MNAIEIETSDDDVFPPDDGRFDGLAPDPIVEHGERIQWTSPSGLKLFIDPKNIEQHIVALKGKWPAARESLDSARIAALALKEKGET